MASQSERVSKAGGQIAAISVDPPETSKEMAQELGISFPLLSDPMLETIDAYRLRADGHEMSVPAVYVIRPDSTIAYRYVGENIMDRPTVDQLVEAVSGAAPR